MLALALMLSLSAPLPRVLVFGIAHDAGEGSSHIDDEQVRTLIDLIAAELAKDKRFTLTTENEMRRAAELAAEKQTVGCDDDSACLAEIAGALDARFVVGGRINKLGGDWVLTLALTDTKTIEVLSRATVTAPTLPELRHRLPEGILQLRAFTHEELQEPPPNALPWIAGVGGGVLAVAGAGAAIVGGLTLADANARARALQNESDPDDAVREKRDVDALAFRGNALLFGGLGAAVVAAAAGALGFVLLGGLE